MSRAIVRARVLGLAVAISAVAASFAATPSAAAPPDPPTWMLKWGSLGSGPGQLNFPAGIATDELGNVYVVDQNNHRVEKFDRNGNFVTQWGSYGFGPAQFYYPTGIAVDLSGNVFVEDGSNYRIQKFTTGGTYLTQWGSSGSGPGQFTGLSGSLAVDAAGNVYVADAHRVQKFTGGGAFVTQWGSLGSGDGQFNAPNSVAVDAAGSVYVVDRLNSRLQKFTSTGTFVTKWSLGGNTKDVAVDPVGDVYTIDDNSHITRYSATGTLEVQWGSAGTGDGQLVGAGSLDVDLEGNVYVADSWNHRVQKWSGWGATLADAPHAPLFGWGTGGTPTGVAVGPAGNLYLGVSDSNLVKVFTPAGVNVTRWGSAGTGAGQFSSPGALAIDNDGNVYVADIGNDRIQKFSSTGTFITQWGTHGSGNGQFDYPRAIAVDASFNVYVADELNHRIQKFTYNGSYVSQWGSSGSGNGQFNFPVGIAVDRTGNILVVDDLNFRVQRFTATGTYLGQWGSFGYGNGQFSYPAGIAADATGNVYVTDNYYIQKFTPSGVFLTQWIPSGSGNSPFVPTFLAADSPGNLYVDNYSNRRIEKFGAPPTLAQVSDVRNDQGRQARLRILRASADASGSGLSITGYAVYRRVDPPPAGASMAPARRTLATSRDGASPASVALAGWDYVTTIPARGDAEYSAVVPTLADANSSSRSYSAFFVSALTSSPSTYFDSTVESGYSIDNLSPPAPTPFTAAYMAGATHLHWGVSAASDFATFRLYRGASAGFVPAPGNLVTATTDTGYVDVGGAGSYYKLAAVDLNGNESPYAIVGPAQTTDVPGEGGAVGFALGEIRPNPLRARDLIVRFTLAGGEPARLELADVAGRRVAERAIAGAGEHVVDLGREHLAAGVYFVKLTQGANVRVRRALVLD